MHRLYTRTGPDGHMEEMYVYFSRQEVADALRSAGLVPEGMQVRYCNAVSGPSGEFYVEMSRVSDNG